MLRQPTPTALLVHPHDPSRSSHHTPEAVGKSVHNRVPHHILILRPQKLPQPVGIHDVFPCHVRHSLGRNRRDFPLPAELQDLLHGPSSRHPNQLRLGHLYAPVKGQGLTATRNVQHGQTLSLRFPPQDVHNQPRHVVDMHELNLVDQVLPPPRQDNRKPFSRLSHLPRPFALAVWRAMETSHQVIFYACAGKNVWPQDVHAAAPQSRSSLLHHLVRLLL